MDDYAEKCEQDRNCTMFTFDNNNNRCRLKAACPTLLDRRVVLGVRKSRVWLDNCLMAINISTLIMLLESTGYILGRSLNDQVKNL